MPDLISHQRQVAHNHAARAYLEQAGVEHLDWVVTIVFYTAMHLVDQVLYYQQTVNAIIQPASTQPASE